MDTHLLLQQTIAVLVPIVTGYVTKWLTQLMKRVNAFAASRPTVKQLVTFAISFAISLVTAHFGTTDLNVILNTVLGGALAQLFYNGQKVATA
jgi:hypothetical protein